MKRLMPLLLAVILLLSACGGGTPAETASAGTAAAGTSAETAAPETEPELTDDVPALDFKGAAYTFMTYKPTGGQHCYTTITEQTGEVLNDAMYQRTQEIAERFNVVFKEDYAAENNNAMVSEFTAAVTAGDKSWNAAMLLERRAYALQHQSYFRDMKGMKYIDFTKPYWFETVNAAINPAGKRLIAYGSLVLTYYDYMHVLLFNKKMQSDLKLDSPYDLVTDGAWTFDKMSQMALAAVSDKDGDGVWGTGDVYGIVGTSRSLVGDFIAAAQKTIISSDKNGALTVNLLTDPAIETIYSKVNSTFWQPGFWYTKSTDINNYFLKDTYFQTNQALFAEHTFCTTQFLRDMEADYGIVPYPKWTADQDGYGTMIEAGARVLAVPATSDNDDLNGALIEALTCSSYKNVVPAYYENVLKGKYSRDSVSAQMLDIILDSVIYDLGDTMFCEYVVSKIFQPLFQNNRTDYVSTVTSVMPTIDKAIADAKGA